MRSCEVYWGGTVTSKFSSFICVIDLFPTPGAKTPPGVRVKTKDTVQITTTLGSELQELGGELASNGVVANVGWVGLNRVLDIRC